MVWAFWESVRLHIGHVKDIHSHWWFRYGTNPKVERAFILSSATPASPIDLSDFDDDDENEPPKLFRHAATIKTPSKASASAKTVPNNPATTVTEPRFTPAQRFRNQTQETMGGISKYLHKKA